MELDHENLFRNTTLKLIDLQLSMIKLEDQMKALQDALVQTDPRIHSQFEKALSAAHRESADRRRILESILSTLQPPVDGTPN
jgi:hypothetical protein